MIMKNSGGEIVQVQGGHILRSTGRKDRHSKVVTTKGRRDRRVRLAAHTAIQFYDVQDRLGYDRPSKAVDWLMNKVKNAIDKLAEIPPWNPPNDATMDPSADPIAIAGSTGMALGGHQSGLEPSSGYAFHEIHRQLGESPDSGPSSFLQVPPPSMDTQSMADTMKSFFPISSGPGSLSMNFQDYPLDVIMTRTSAQTEEDLCISLHSLQDPSSSRRRRHHHHTTASTDHHQILFPGSSPVVFEANYPRLVPWNGEHREGYIFSSQQFMPLPPPQPFLCQSSVLSQRGPLQSSFSPSVHAWNDHPIHSNLHHTTLAIQQSSMSSSQFQFASNGLLQFQALAQIHSEDHHHGLVSNKPSSASPNSHH